MERLNRELQGRTRIATLFANKASLLRLVSGVLVEIGREWETGRIDLGMARTNPFAARVGARNTD